MLTGSMLQDLVKYNTALKYISQIEIVKQDTIYSFQQILKGKLGNFFRLKICICQKLRQVSIGNFHRITPKLVKNQLERTN